MKSFAAGFTLTELLVVLGIIAVLTAVLLPVFCHPPKAHQTTCAANLKQIALATFAYTQDYDGSFPV